VRPAPAALAALLAGAACFEYSPHALPDEERHRAVHGRSLARLGARPPPDRLRFAVLGDTQLGLDETADAIDALNRRDDLAFVVQLGDFTHNALAREYELTNDLFAELRVPYFVVVGNHDLIANGRDVYERMFGPPDLAFTWAEARFVLLDTNSREAGMDGSVPDVAWLADALAQDPAAPHRRAFVFSHCDPTSSDFDPALVAPFIEALRAGGVAISFHGHRHSDADYERDGVRFRVADDVDGRAWYLVAERDDGGFDVEKVGF
jgi:3',5'-cyclic AMP phosphodiesterase CpdA